MDEPVPLPPTGAAVPVIREELLAREAAVDVPRPRVLVVDDNGANQKVAARMLERFGCTVEVASNGLEAVEMVRRMPFQVVFMDCMMPEMDGYEATAAIRRLSGPIARTPIVAMTANAMQGDRERCLAAGMDDYLSKPVQSERLRQALEQWSGTTLAAPAPRPGAVPRSLPVDPQVLADLRQLQEDAAPDVVTEFIDLFLADLPGKSKAILQALAAGAGEPLQAAAHTLKCSSAYIGASGLARLCHDFETAGRLGNLAASQNLTGVFEEEVERVAGYLRAQRQAPAP
jgi:CheY-like chemotaxis protein/HPt (histidine-containing phosphotransfer) domain-containing protein